ncbi:MAG: fused MFS/spermidine synthase [Thermoanaerobaculia bacterium]
MTRKTLIVAGLLFCSGLSALIYQTVWLREFRLIFGVSTYATGAVLAIFMGGLGFGSAILGKRADTKPSPLRFYGRLELLIAACAALSLPLLWLVTKVYFALGGSMKLGIGLATVVRLLLAFIVIGAPTFLMGGTLPAAARAVMTSGDLARHRVALLYGANTLGAVVGTLLSTFFLLEALGNRATLILAALINAIIATIAIVISKHYVIAGSEDSEGFQPAQHEIVSSELPPFLVLLASGVVGFSFLLIELVWYRMLAPLLGGTTFMFGLILAIALLGVGLGGWVYGAWNRASALALSITAGLEAALLILPFVIGDTLAGYALLLRDVGNFGFASHVMVWSGVTAFVVLPAALVAGFQFPLLIALLGRGSEGVGRHVGMAYAWNTVGSIVGSLAGGFGLLPILSAPGAWRLVTIVLAALALVIAGAFVWVPASAGTARAEARGHTKYAAVPVVLALLAIGGTFARGPSAVWRHSGIGIGNWQPPKNINEWRGLVNRYRRSLIWEADGRESSVGELGGDDLSFIVNGKSDGSARADAGTQVMLGMVGAILHPNPRTAMVIGLGTGSSAGWLGTVPTMERVDSVELEPVVLRVAHDCAPVNHDVMHNPKVHTTIADAREALLASRQRYDIISSEPANPYRAGVASLFTTDFYAATKERLAPGGILLQWVQAYSVHAATMETIYATISSVFPHVDTFWTQPDDMLIIASADPITYDINSIRARLQSRAIGTAAHVAWRAETPEAFLSHFIANENTAKELAARARVLNSDDRTVIEFGFARGLGMKSNLLPELADYAARRGESRPAHIRGEVNWREVDMNRASDVATNVPQGPDQELVNRRRFTTLMMNGDIADAGALWLQNPWRAVSSADIALIGEAVADHAAPVTPQFIAALERLQPIEADVVRARFALRQQRYDEAAAALERAFTAYQTNPWPHPLVMRHGLRTAIELVQRKPGLAPRLDDVLAKPIPPHQLDELRRNARLEMAAQTEQCGPRTLAVLKEFEPEPPWSLAHLQIRLACYERAGLRDLAKRARQDYLEYLEAEPASLAR